MTIRHHQPLQVIPGEADPGLTELPDAGFPDAFVVYNYDFDYDAIEWVKHSSSASGAGGGLTNTELRASAVDVAVSGATFNTGYLKVMAVQEEGVRFTETLVGATDFTGIGNVGDALKTTAPDLICSIEYDANNLPLYRGLAAKGSLKSQAVWQMTKFTTDSTNITDWRYANASSAFNAIYDDRASLSYS